MKQIIKNYTFSVSGKTVTLTDFTTIRLDRLLLIVDATTNKILYNYADTSVTAAAVATNVVTLTALQGGEANGDSLIIFYDVLSTDPVATLYGYPEPVSSGFLSVAYTTTTAQAVGSTDVGNFRWVSVQITSQGTSSSVAFQGSNDNTNWVQIGLTNTGSGNQGNVGSTGATGIYAGPLQFRYFRLSVTGISAGTTAGTLIFSAMPSQLQPSMTANQGGTWTVQPGNTANTTAWKVDGSAVTQPVSGTVTANAGSATGSAVPANAFYMGVKNGANLVGLAEGQGTMANSLPVAIASDQVITDNFATDTALTITLASLANSATVGRQSTLVDNTTNKYQSALVYLSLKMGTSPTANTPLYVYLLRSNNDNPIADDSAGTTDAGITIINAPLLGVINCSATTTGATYVGIFDTSVLGPLGPKWAIAVVNNSGVALDSTEGNHLKTFIGVTRSI